jgi:hypothetical protein
MVAAGAFTFSRSLLLGLGLLQAQVSDIPKELKPPAKQVLILYAHGKGRQIYTCQSAAGQYVWKLKAPDARLLDASGKQVGRHFAGPSWEANDGSRVIGKLTASVPSSDADSIPWLLLSAKSTGGEGTFSKVKSIQRLNTKGGKAPGTGCDASHDPAETSVSYEADYYFYGIQ